jgi:hypothetical protein
MNGDRQGYVRGMERDVKTIEEVRSMFQAALVAADELCRESMRLRQESDRLIGRIAALEHARPESIPAWDRSASHRRLALRSG